MKLLSSFYLTFFSAILFLSVGCSPVQTSSKIQQENQEQESYRVENIILSSEGRLFAFHLGVYGHKGLKEEFSQRDDLLKDIAVSHLRNVTSSELKESKRISRKLTRSFNQFFDGSLVVAVRLEEFKEL